MFIKFCDIWINANFTNMETCIVRVKISTKLHKRAICIRVWVNFKNDPYQNFGLPLAESGNPNFGNHANLVYYQQAKKNSYSQENDFAKQTNVAKIRSLRATHFRSWNVLDDMCSLWVQESPADAVKPARRKSMPKLLQFDVFRFISTEFHFPKLPMHSFTPRL